MDDVRVSQEYPLHWLVWNDRPAELQDALVRDEYDKEQLDPRGRTPVHLAIALGHTDCLRVLLEANCNANALNKSKWTALQEAICTGTPDILALIIRHRDKQRISNRVAAIPELLDALKTTPDFYIEMKWEFTSWIPLVTRAFPTDTCKIWKKGAYLRVDTTLLSLDENIGKTGNRSIIFKGSESGAVIIEIDHEKKRAFSETINIDEVNRRLGSEPPSEVVFERLRLPVTSTIINIDDIEFARQKCGIWGWRSNRTEFINNYETKVYTVSNIAVVTRTRFEHLSEEDKARAKSERRSFFHSLMGNIEQYSSEKDNTEVVKNETEDSSTDKQLNLKSLIPKDYFYPEEDTIKRDIGLSKEMSIKEQRFKVSLWLCDEHRLSLREQVLPIISLMAISNPHFQKLHDFISMQLPSGFPIKIEIPLYHVLNARVTFANLNGEDEPVNSVTLEEVNEEDDAAARTICSVDESCFEIPPDYASVESRERDDYGVDEEDMLLHYALQKSVREQRLGDAADTIVPNDALMYQQFAYSMNMDNDAELSWAIEESLRSLSQDSNHNTGTSVQGNNNIDQKQEETIRDVTNVTDPVAVDDFEKQMRLAIQLSSESANKENKLHAKEDEELRLALELSLEDR